MVFKLMVGKGAAAGSRLEDATHHFQRQRSNGYGADGINITDFFGRPRKQHVQIYAFATFDGEIAAEYV